MTSTVLWRGCGSSRYPEIIALRPILDAVVQRLSDKRIAALVSVLRTGSPDEQRRMIDNVRTEVFRKISLVDDKN